MTMQHGLIVEDGVARNYDPPGRTLTGIWDINPSGATLRTWESTRQRLALVTCSGHSSQRPVIE